jgi:hypothetical protein
MMLDYDIAVVVEFGIAMVLDSGNMIAVEPGTAVMLDSDNMIVIEPGTVVVVDSDNMIVVVIESGTVAMVESDAVVVTESDTLPVLEHVGTVFALVTMVEDNDNRTAVVSVAALPVVASVLNDNQLAVVLVLPLAVTVLVAVVQNPQETDSKQTLPTRVTPTFLIEAILRITSETICMSLHTFASKS